MKQGIIQMGLFDEKACEVLDGGLRYILRRNPLRVEEIARTRLSKQRSVERYLNKKNLYLQEHPRARVSTAIKGVRARHHF